MKDKDDMEERDSQNDRDPLKDIAEIKALMRGTTTRMSRNAGWFFIVWGAVWISGFVTTQIIGDTARFVWPWLNLLGIVVTIILGRHFFGKRGNQMVSGLGSRIVLITIGTIVFGALVALLFDIDTTEDITLLIVLMGGVGYYIAGVVGPRSNMILGLLLWATALIGRFAAPGYLPLVTAISGGGAFLAVGISFLARKET